MGSGAFARSKGQRAEREVVNILQNVVNLVYEGVDIEPPILQRNLMQSHMGGHDIAGLEWIALEVKHQETLHINQWWEQTKRQAGTSRIPVLLYKQNRVKWRVLLYGYLDCGQIRVKCPCDIALDAFLIWFENKLKSELNSST